MNTIKIDDRLKATPSGVYLISFSTGHFYIGSSQELWSRTQTHVRSIRSGFTTSMTCKSLLPMKGFIGSAEISLLEAFAMEGIYGRHKLLRVEWGHIEARIEDPMMLNDPISTGNSRGMGIHVKTYVHQKIKAIAQEKGIKLSEYVEGLLRQAIKDHESISSNSETSSF